MVDPWALVVEWEWTGASTDASIAKVYFGSLGLGGQAFCPEALGGSNLTLVFSIGLPAFFLLIGALCDASLQATIAKYIVTTDGIQLVQDENAISTGSKTNESISRRFRQTHILTEFFGVFIRYAPVESYRQIWYISLV